MALRDRKRGKKNKDMNKEDVQRTVRAERREPNTNYRPGPEPEVETMEDTTFADEQPMDDPRRSASDAATNSGFSGGDGAGGDAGAGAGAGASNSRADEAINAANNYFNSLGDSVNNSIFNAQNPILDQAFRDEVQGNLDADLAYVDDVFDLGYEDGTAGTEGAKYREAGNTILDQMQARGILDSNMTTGELKSLDDSLLRAKADMGYQARNRAFDQLMGERTGLRDLNSTFTQLFGQQQGQVMSKMMDSALAGDQIDLERAVQAGNLSLEQAKLLAELIQFETVNRNNILQQMKNNNKNNRAYQDQQDLLDRQWDYMNRGLFEKFSLF